MNGNCNSKAGIVALVLLCLGLASVAGAAEVAELLKQTPGKTAAEQQQVSVELMKLGAPAIKQLASMVVPPDKGGDVAARYALHDLAMYAGRPLGDADRKVFALAIAEAAQADGPPVVRQFLLHQLRLCATPDVIAPVSKLLAVEELCDPATQVLLTIRSDAATDALRSALAGAAGKSRVTIIKALGDLRDRKAVAILLKDATSDDMLIRHTAFYALGASGDLAAGDVLAKASMAESRYERLQGLKAYLLLIERLIDGGQKDAAAKMCRELYKRPIIEGEAHVPCAAMSYLAMALGADAMDDLTVAMESPNAQVKALATDLALAIPGGGHHAAVDWSALSAAEPAAKAGILSMLGRRGGQGRVSGGAGGDQGCRPGGSSRGDRRGRDTGRGMNVCRRSWMWWIRGRMLTGGPPAMRSS